MTTLSLNLILDLLLLAGEAAWIYGWALTVGSWIGGSRDTLLSLPILLALMAVPAFLVRQSAALSGRKRSFGMAATVLLGVGAVVAVSVSKLPLSNLPFGNLAFFNSWLDGETGGRAVLAGGAAGLAWRRGLALGRARADVSAVDDSFGTGIVGISSLLAIVGLSAGATHVSSDALIAPTLIVLASGLIGMALARIVEVSARPRHRHGPGITLGGPWLVMLLSIVTAILVVTLILAKLFTFDRISAVLDAVGSSVDSVLWTVIYVLAIPIGLLVQALIFLGSLLARPGAQKPRPQQPQIDPFSQAQQAGAAQVSPELLFFLKVALGILCALLLAWILWRAISRLQRMWEEDDVEEERESVWSWPGWGAVWSWLVSRLRPLHKKAAALVFHRTEGPREGEHSVRGVYRDLLRLGARIGHPRHLSETPLEYESRLDRVAPEGSEQAGLITQTYALTRYGPPTPGAANLNPLSEALAQLRVIWRDRARH